jgi:ABC-type lipoprotein release transport system permease subunit
MIIFRLAWRNLTGAGLRTWLNVLVLSFAFVAIVGAQGLLEGMNQQATTAIVDAQYGGGQYWHDAYDPYDPLSLENAHAPVPGELQGMVDAGTATPILIVQGSIYPEGRMRPVLLKGIDPGQTVLSIPSHVLNTTDADALPVLIGSRMARSTGLDVGEYVTVQWRDADGTYDASDAVVVQVMTTTVPTVDNGQVWVPLDQLQKMTEMEDEATIVVRDQDAVTGPAVTGWVFRNKDYLLSDIRALVQSKTVGSAIVYVILLFLAMIAIFDTQVLSIFRRKKEIGMLMAMGLTRFRVIQLFTLEGALHGVLAAVVGALYGVPLLGYVARIGWALPQNVDNYGFAIGEKLFPVYSAGLIITTTVIVFVITTIVSFLPTRRIARLKPHDALRGRLA